MQCIRSERMISPLASSHSDRNSARRKKKAHNVASLTVIWLQLEMTAHHPHTCHSSLMDMQVVRSSAVSSGPPHMLIVVALWLALGSSACLLTLGERPRTCRVATAGTHPPCFACRLRHAHEHTETCFLLTSSSNIHGCLH